MFSYYTPTTIWEFVQPRRWYPMTELEQSLMELDEIQQELTWGFPVRSFSRLSLPSANDDDGFFRDLPTGAKESASTSSSDTSREGDKSVGSSSNYSYSSSTIVDDKGHRIHSVRRRYEDANGRLKATHERRVDDKRMVATWTKSDKSDQGQHDTMCSEGTTAEEFEKLWSETPFAKAKKSKQQIASGQTNQSLEGEQTSSTPQGTKNEPAQVEATTA